MILKSEKIKTFLSQKKNITIVYVIVIIGIIMLSFPSLFTADEVPEEESGFMQMKDMEKDMEKILSEIYGVGKCRVLITYKSTSEYVPAKDTSISEGENSRNTDEKNLVTGSGSNEKPFIVKEKMPEIQGALVVCSGGENTRVKNDVINAVCALTGLPQNRVKVFRK